MPRFFFDTTDPRGFVRDELGLDFPDVEAARKSAVAALPDMARDVPPGGDACSFLVLVRDEHGEPLLRTSLEFRMVWMS